MASAQLSSAHRYAAGGLFALALSQAQLHQHSQVGFGFPPVIDPADDGASSGSQSGGGMPWSLEESGLVRHVFRYLGIDRKAWVGLESTSVSAEAKDHISAFLRLMGEDDAESQNLAGDEAAPAKAVDAVVESTKEKQGIVPAQVDLTEMVDGQTSYLTSLKHILQGIDIDSFYASQPHKLHMSAQDKKIAASTAAVPAPR